MTRRAPAGAFLGRLESGEAYYAPLGQMRYDGEDRAQCHLCGRWLKLVGGNHLIKMHGWTTEEYRDAFQLDRSATTAAPEVGEAHRVSMFEQIHSGQRDQSAIPRPGPPTVPSWRSLAVLYPVLLAELHPSRNGDLDPYRTGAHTQRKVWWRCGGCGHEWMAEVHGRSRGHGCPKCANRRTAVALRKRQALRERSLGTLRPDLLAEWHLTRNDLDPYAVGPGSERRAWWRCGGCGHEWDAVIYERARKERPGHHGGCPACGHRRGANVRAHAPRERSLAALHPQLLEEWHATLNGDLDPFAIKPGSDRPVWWHCRYCGRDWQAPPVSRRESPRGGCPTCAMGMARGVEIPAGSGPVGRLQDGTVYYGTLGELAYDGDDRVQCHLGGGWFKLVGGSHLIATHGWTLDTYREAFHLPEKAATCSHDLSERSRRRARAELASHRAAGFGTPPPKKSTYRRARWRSLAAKRPDLAAELHPSRNGGLDSSAIAPTSKRKIWWRCKRCEHEWQAAIANRVLLGAGCPGCGIKRRGETQSHVPPERSLAVRYPQLAAELHPTRNGNRDLRVLGAASGRPVWWKCPTCSHEWQAPPASRTSARPSGCPSCWQRRRGALQRIVPFERSLAAKHPGLAAELHSARNDGVDPTRLGARSGQKLWWRCGDCGHEWKTAVSTRSGGSGCPRCARER